MNKNNKNSPQNSGNTLPQEGLSSGDNTQTQTKNSVSNILGAKEALKLLFEDNNIGDSSVIDEDFGLAVSQYNKEIKENILVDLKAGDLDSARALFGFIELEEVIKDALITSLYDEDFELSEDIIKTFGVSGNNLITELEELFDDYIIEDEELDQIFPRFINIIGLLKIDYNTIKHVLDKLLQAIKPDSSKRYHDYTLEAINPGGFFGDIDRVFEEIKDNPEDQKSLFKSLLYSANIFWGGGEFRWIDEFMDRYSHKNLDVFEEEILEYINGYIQGDIDDNNYVLFVLGEFVDRITNKDLIKDIYVENEDKIIEVFLKPHDLSFPSKNNIFYNNKEDIKRFIDKSFEIINNENKSDGNIKVYYFLDYGQDFYEGLEEHVYDKVLNIYGKDLIDNPYRIETMCDGKINYDEYYDKGHLPKIIQYFLIYLHEEFGIKEEKPVYTRLHDYVFEKQEALIKKHAKNSISSEYIKEVEELDPFDYLLVAQYVFKEGEYSSFLDIYTNITNDSLEHVENYEFDRLGYPVTLTGLLGYRLKNGEEEDLKKLHNFSSRIGKIKDFYDKRLLTEEKLSKKLDNIIKDSETIGGLEVLSLSTEEKVIAVFIGEIIKKFQDADYSIPDDILDLVVMYKYSGAGTEFGEYVHRSRDFVKGEKDAISRNRLLWNELSIIYGEDFKHTLRNKILKSFASGENYNEIVRVFLDNIGRENEEVKLKDNQISAIKNTFENDNIPEDKKFSVFKKQVIRIFTSGIKLEDNLREELISEISEVCDEISKNLTYEYFLDNLSELRAIRQKYKLGLYEKLSEIFENNIKEIQKEVDKYQEILEREVSKSEYEGVDKGVTKKAKKRNIRGYFTKTEMTANARMGAFLCIAGDHGMWDNPNYFELVLQNEDTHKCEGLVMLLNIEAQDGKKYLWFGPNPNESFLEKVSTKKCYEYLYNTVVKFAKNNSYDGIVIPPEEKEVLGCCTNRGGDFPLLINSSRLKDKNGDDRIVNFGTNHTISGEYKYSKGALIWEKD